MQSKSGWLNGILQSSIGSSTIQSDKKEPSDFLPYKKNFVEIFSQYFSKEQKEFPFSAIGQIRHDYLEKSKTEMLL